MEVCSFFLFFFIFCLFLFFFGGYLSVMGIVNRTHVLLVIGY